MFLLALAAIGFIGTLNLPFGQLSGVGPGLMPRTVSLLVAVFGVYFVARAVLLAGAPLDRLPLRGPFFVLGAALVFAWTIRPLGLILAGPLTVMIAAAADRQSRPLEAAIFAAVLTAACIGLFSFALRLPIPVLPSSVPYPFNLWL